MGGTPIKPQTEAASGSEQFARERVCGMMAELIVPANQKADRADLSAEGCIFIL